MALVLEAAADKKAEDPMAINLKGIATFTDGFVIVTGAQRRQTQAICDAILERMAAEGEKSNHVEGYERGDWILIDLSDLVVHVFTPETRIFYGLERLWGDAPTVSARDKPEPRKASRSGAAPRRKTARAGVRKG